MLRLSEARTNEYDAVSTSIEKVDTGASRTIFECILRRAGEAIAAVGSAGGAGSTAAMRGAAGADSWSTRAAGA